MAFIPPSMELTEKIVEARGSRVWDGFIESFDRELFKPSRREDYEVKTFVTVRACQPMSGWSPPKWVRLEWRHATFPEPGSKVVLMLARADGWERQETYSIWSETEFAYFSEDRWIIRGLWDVLLPEEMAEDRQCADTVQSLFAPEQP